MKSAPKTGKTMAVIGLMSALVVTVFSTRGALHEAAVAAEVDSAPRDNYFPNTESLGADEMSTLR